VLITWSDEAECSAVNFTHGQLLLLLLLLFACYHGNGWLGNVVVEQQNDRRTALTNIYNTLTKYGQAKCRISECLWHQYMYKLSRRLDATLLVLVQTKLANAAEARHTYILVFCGQDSQQPQRRGACQRVHCSVFTRRRCKFRAPCTAQPRSQANFGLRRTICFSGKIIFVQNCYSPDKIFGLSRASVDSHVGYSVAIQFLVNQ